MFCQSPQPAHLLPADDLDLDDHLHGGHLDGVLPQLHHRAHRLQQEEEDGGHHDRRGRGRDRHQPHPSYQRVRYGLILYFYVDLFKSLNGRVMFL